MGMTGIKRLDQQFQLILLSPKTGESESVLSGIYFPEYLDWSPDGKSITFVSSLDEDNQAIFVFDVKARSLILIAKGKVFSFQDLSWSPDSQSIAVLWCDGIDCENSEIRKYSIPAIK
jgi:Tol biopolymer transport system component